MEEHMFQSCSGSHSKLFSQHNDDWNDTSSFTHTMTWQFHCLYFPLPHCSHIHISTFDSIFLCLDIFISNLGEVRDQYTFKAFNSDSVSVNTSFHCASWKDCKLVCQFSIIIMSILCLWEITTAFLPTSMFDLLSAANDFYLFWRSCFCICSSKCFNIMLMQPRHPREEESLGETPTMRIC